VGNNGGSAFPVGLFTDGITKRDYFAAHALIGMLSNHKLSELGPPLDGAPTLQWFAANAYEMADAMLAERDK
jgi:hypothetical protein